MTAEGKDSDAATFANRRHQPKEPVRAIVYIDGFNLYYGLKTFGRKNLYWLNVFGMAGEIAQDRDVVAVKYFTADVSGNSDGASRQRVYLAALQEVCPALKIIKG